MSCKIYEKEVVWTIKNDIISKILSNFTKEYEIAGSILFEDSTCKNGICNKISKELKLNHGEESSVVTPRGIVNFHTHPESAYKGENAKYGWPSGEDMEVCIDFAKMGNLVHIVFSLEGAYVISVLNKNINKTLSKRIKKLLQLTHVFRSEDQKNQRKEFIEFSKISAEKTFEIWIKFINTLTPKKITEMYNKNFKKNVKVPSDNNLIYNVKLLSYGNSFKFKAGFIDSACHSESFYG
jgi:hypothetical protein